MAPERSAELEPSRDAPRRARECLRTFLELWDAVDAIDEAGLLTSELVANAVRHAVAQVELRIELDAGRLRVEVWDGAPERPPRLQTPSPTGPDQNGYGLRLVDELADLWGHEVVGDRKVVWFELHHLR